MFHGQRFFFVMRVGWLIMLENGFASKDMFIFIHFFNKGLVKTVFVFIFTLNFFFWCVTRDMYPILINMGG